MAWTTPRDWVPGEIMTADKMQQQSDDLTHLYSKPSLLLTIRGNGTNETSTSTTFVAINNTILSGSLVCTGGAPIYVGFDATLTHSVANGGIFCDVLIDGVTYVSSLTSTAVTNGLWSFRNPTTSSIHASGRHIIPAGSLAAGAHTFGLVWRAGAAGTITLSLNTFLAQFSVTE